MDENKKSAGAVDEFLGDLKHNSDDSVFEPSKADPFENQVINTEEPKEEGTKEVVEDKPLPFHKDPKIQKYLEKREKEMEERFRAQFQNQTPAPQTVKSAEEDADIWERIIGNDTPEKVAAIKDLRKALSDRDEQTVQRTLQTLQQQREAELAEERAAEQELMDGFEHVEATFGVDLTSNTITAQKARNEFIEFIQRIAPKKDGEILAYPDFEEAYKLLAEKKKPEPNLRARELASRGMSRSAEATPVQPDRDYSWRGAEKALSSMFKK